MNGMTIGKLAKQTGVSAETIRFYERQGLIEPPLRADSNYRIYPDGEVGRLKFIKRAKNLGFSLSEIKELLNLRHDPRATKGDVKSRTVAKIEDVSQKIDDLTRIKKALEQLASCCDGQGPLEDCPIILALDNDTIVDTDRSEELS
jgi:MerR family transcriptional regulator, copper efflux regulator